MVPMGTSGRSGWGAASVTRVPGSRWRQSVGIKEGRTYPVGRQQHYLLRNKKVWGQMQAIQINTDAATPNVSVSVTSPRAARVISQKVLQKAQWGLALPERDAAGAAAWGLRLGDGPGQSLHGPKGAFGAPSP